MGKTVKSVTKSVFGGGGSTGMLGTGRFKASQRKIDKDVFAEKVAGEGTQEALRKKQAAQSERLEARSRGEVPSIAEAQLKQAQDRSLSQQLAAAQSRRGGSAASRERQLAKASAGSRQEIAQQAATAKLQEQQLAEQALTGQLTNQRQQDISLAEGDRSSKQAYEQLATKQHLAAQGANLSGFQSAAAARGQLVKNLGEAAGQAAMMKSDKDAKTNIKKESNSGSFQAVLGRSEEPKIKKQLAKNKAADKAEKLKKAKSFKLSDSNYRDDGTGKGMLQSAISEMSDKDKKENIKKEDKEYTKKATKSVKEELANIKKAVKGRGVNRALKANGFKITSASDEKSKKNVKESDMSPKSFLDALQAYSYDYKDPSAPGAGEGKHLSVMAQDLEKAGPVGKSAVLDTPNGKMVDYGKLSGAMLASQAHLNERLSKIEGLTKKSGYGKILEARKKSKKQS